jgi:hypothetical protein
LCVEGYRIERRCRYVIPNADRTYSVVDVANGLKAVVTIKSRLTTNNWLVNGKPAQVIDYGGAKYHKLSGPDIQSALYNKKLSYVSRSVLSVSNLSESFFESEMYIMRRPEAPFIYGTWNVVGDMVCVQETKGSKSLCRHVYLDNNKRYVLLVERSGDRRHYTLSTASR